MFLPLICLIIYIVMGSGFFSILWVIIQYYDYLFCCSKIWALRGPFPNSSFFPHIFWEHFLCFPVSTRYSKLILIFSISALKELPLQGSLVPFIEEWCLKKKILVTKYANYYWNAIVCRSSQQPGLGNICALTHVYIHIYLYTCVYLMSLY